VRQTRGWSDPLGKNADLFPVVNVSVKISALYSQMNPAAPVDAIDHLGTKLRPILRRARELGAFVNFDMESFAHKNATLELFKTLFYRIGVSRLAPCRNCQPSLLARRRRRFARSHRVGAKPRHPFFAVRLVKGAYWDYEKIKSRQNGWGCPVFLQKPESDLNFELLTRILLENESIVTAAFGSHNVRSIAHAQALAGSARNRSQPVRISTPLRHGRSGETRACRNGYRVREYCPVGELLPGMSYLVRRLLENTSNEGFLRAKFFRQRIRGRTVARSGRSGSRKVRTARAMSKLAATALPSTRPPEIVLKTRRW